MKARFRFGAALLLLLLSATRNVSAFCAATTCDPADATQKCLIDSRTKCVLSGRPLYWGSSCVTFSLQKDAAPLAGISYAEAKASVERAFEAWTRVNCGGSPPSVRLTLSEPVSCSASEYSADHRNANIIVFRENEWPYEGGEDALGLTRLRFDPSNRAGELYDADIEINAVSEPLSAGKPKPDEVDLDSLITHEMGHALGLAHSLDIEATMLAGYAKGSVNLRSLGSDDLAGICATYAPSRTPTSTSCEPRHGFSARCAAEQPPSEAPLDESPTGDPRPQSRGCSLVATSNKAGRSLLATGFALSLAGVGLERRRKRRQTGRRGS